MLSSEVSTSRVILLNGPPSSGKTTLARGLYVALPDPTFYLSLDAFRGGIQGEFWAGARVKDLFQLMVDAWLSSLREVALRGLPVLAESVILPADIARYKKLFAEFNVVLIGVRCPLAVALQREAQRSDRRSGPVELDTPEFFEVHQHHYALEVDTSIEPTQTSVDRIVGYLQER